MGVNELLPRGLGQSHPVVPVLHEVGLPHLVDLYGGELRPRKLEGAEALPALQGVGGLGEEAVVKVLVAVHGAHHLVHLDGPEAQMALPSGPQRQGLVEGKEDVRLPP